MDGQRLRTVLVYTDDYKTHGRISSYFPDLLVKAFESIGYYAFVLPSTLEVQAC